MDLQIDIDKLTSILREREMTNKAFCLKIGKPASWLSDVRRHNAKTDFLVLYRMMEVLDVEPEAIVVPESVLGEAKSFLDIIFYRDSCSDAKSAQLERVIAELRQRREIPSVIVYSSGSLLLGPEGSIVTVGNPPARKKRGVNKR